MERITSLIEKFCESNEECRYHQGYSSRFMFGKQCVGIVIEGDVFKQIVRLCDFLHENDVDSAEESLGRICIDSFGMGKIIYFPNLALECEK